MLYIWARYFFYARVREALIAKTSKKGAREESSTYLNLWRLDFAQKLRRVIARIISLRVVHYTLPQVSGLSIIALLPFMPEMALSAHNVIIDSIRRLCCIWTKLVRETVWSVFACYQHD